MEKIKIMISSTVTDLLGERHAAVAAFANIPFVELVGAEPLTNTSSTSSSNRRTRELARECDLYILILGNRFGWELANGRSATEVEYNEALKDNPTKILIFLKEDGSQKESKQIEFIQKVSDYSKGYWRSSFTYTHELQKKIEDSFYEWLKEKAAIGKHLTYIDHFIRTAIQRKPEADSTVYYRTFEDLVELEYKVFNKIHKIHFSKQEILNNFWGCLANLEDSFDKWINDEHN